MHAYVLCVAYSTCQDIYRQDKCARRNSIWGGHIPVQHLRMEINEFSSGFWGDRYKGNILFSYNKSGWRSNTHFFFFFHKIYFMWGNIFFFSKWFTRFLIYWKKNSFDLFHFSNIYYCDVCSYFSIKNYIWEKKNKIKMETSIVYLYF